MSFQQLDLRSIAGKTFHDAEGLSIAFSPLLGEPYRFARVSYGDELVLHFGETKPARSPKLAGLLYGSVTLALRGSRWSLRSKPASIVVSGDRAARSLSGGRVGTLTSEELERKRLIEPGSTAVSVRTFPAPAGEASVEGIALSIAFSDGSSLFVVPAADDATAGAESLPEIADVEMHSPEGILRVGPGRSWGFERFEDAD